MADDSPLELVLKVMDGPGLLVEILNRSPDVQGFCFDTFWQPCILSLKDMSGELVDHDDSRTRMKPTTPIGSSAFGSLGPGMGAELQSSQFVKLGDVGYDLTWGYCRFRNIPPGTYLAVATMDCQRDSWADEERRWHTEHGVWKGVLISNDAKIKLSR